MWYTLMSDSGKYVEAEWGWSGTLPVPADYDGDGTDDIAIYQPSSGFWLILYDVETGAQHLQQFGTFQTRPVPGDYDGDGTDDIVVYHRQTGLWSFLNSTEGYKTKSFGWNVVFPPWFRD